MPEITSINYDALLRVFCGNDDFKPGMKQPNKIGDKTYATDGAGLIVIPNNYLVDNYELHPEAPEFEPVFEQMKNIDPWKFKDTDLFKALEVHPKVYGTTICSLCDGEGECGHCGAECEKCDGDGYVVDKSSPMIYTDQASIQIGDQYFSPLQLGRLEKVIIESLEETFLITAKSDVGALFKVGIMELVICRLFIDENDKYPNTILTPINN